MFRFAGTIYRNSSLGLWNGRSGTSLGSPVIGSRSAIKVRESATGPPGPIPNPPPTSTPSHSPPIKWKDFLAQHAKFPVPSCIQKGAASSASSPKGQVQQLERQWNAEHAIRDDTLVQKLLDALDVNLGDDIIPESSKDELLTRFSPLRRPDKDEWALNDSESQTKMFLVVAFFPAVRTFLDEYGSYGSRFLHEHRVREVETRTTVDYLLEVQSQHRVLIEAKSPSVMSRATRKPLPMHIELRLDNERDLMVKTFIKAKLYLAHRKLEWLFLTSYNDWIVLRLVQGDHHHSSNCPLFFNAL